MTSSTATTPLQRMLVPQHALLAVAAMLCAAGAALSALGAMSGNKAMVVVPVVLAIGTMAAAIAATRFGLFVMLMLALRASIDVSKLSADDTAGPTASAMSSRVLTPSTLVVGLFIVAAALWLLAQRRSGTLHPGTPLRWAWAGFAAAAFISLLASTNRTTTMIAATQVLSIALMYIVLEELMAEVRTRNKILIAVYVSALGPVLYTIAGFALGDPNGEVKDGIFRIAGTFTQSNSYGRYLMLLILFGIAVLRHVPRRWRVWFGALIGLFTVLMLLTYTLTAILGAVLGVFVLAIWHGRRVLIGMVVILCLGVALAPGLATRVASVTSEPAPYYSADYHPNSMLWRFSYWGDVLPLAERSPVTGIGLGTTGQVTAQNKQPHNDFLRAYVEEGALGLVAYLLLLVAMARVGLRAVRSSRTGSLDHSIGAGYLACVTAFIVTSTSENMFSNVAVLWYLVAFAAAASSVARPRHLQVDDSGVRVAARNT
ncbi:MAG TPA: O-antigen ligase family protein [Nocardioidaceae bacterium]|nr:O-antigen ligase family protein [Nocardioidaceae bacterium]